MTESGISATIQHHAKGRRNRFPHVRCEVNNSYGQEAIASGSLTQVVKSTSFAESSRIWESDFSLPDRAESTFPCFIEDNGICRK